jgi:hypothetical protein
MNNKYSSTTKALTWSEGKSVVAQLTKLFLRIPDKNLDLVLISTTVSKLDTDFLQIGGVVRVSPPPPLDSVQYRRY